MSHLFKNKISAHIDTNKISSGEYDNSSSLSSSSNILSELIIKHDTEPIPDYNMKESTVVEVQLNQH